MPFWLGVALLVLPGGVTRMAQGNALDACRRLAEPDLCQVGLALGSGI
jgi:hypothetical protein